MYYHDVPAYTPEQMQTITNHITDMHRPHYRVSPWHYPYGEQDSCWECKREICILCSEQDPRTYPTSARGYMPYMLCPFCLPEALRDFRDLEEWGCSEAFVWDASRLSLLAEPDVDFDSDGSEERSYDSDEYK